VGKQVLGGGQRARLSWHRSSGLGMALNPGVFDVLVVDDYLADQHLTTFLRRVHQLSNAPRVIVMQASAPIEKQIRHYMSIGASQIVQKHLLAELCQTVAICAAEMEALLN
jgi:DNA-binding NtrC family response regulator